MKYRGIRINAPRPLNESAPVYTLSEAEADADADADADHKY